MKWIFIALILVVIPSIIVSGCTSQQTNIPNPASENCINLGGRLEIRTDSTGNQYGMCKLGEKACEEWSLFRGECKL